MRIITFVPSPTRVRVAHRFGFFSSMIRAKGKRNRSAVRASGMETAKEECH